MAITKTYINGNHAALGEFLQSLVPDFFASVTDTTSGWHCKDADDNVVAYITTNGYNARLYAASSKQITPLGQIGNVTYGYKTTHGAMLLYGENSRPIILAKTSTGALGGVLPTEPAAHYDYYTCAWGDQVDALAHRFGGLSVEDDGLPVCQTVLCPVPSHGALGAPSVFEGVYWLPWAQYRTVGEISIDGVQYATNGYLAIKDE